ncbi:MAG: SRPBCC domain-containing protein [Pseudomonadota bacterium]
MIEPVVKTLDVPCSQQTAFRVFVAETASWWPLDKNSVSAMQGNCAKHVLIEPREGGRVLETTHDDQTEQWGTVTCYSPSDRLTLDWHIGLPQSQASTVDVTFAVIDESTTRVTLTHSNWESFGEKARDMREGYNGGWVGVFEQAYGGACQALTA